MGIIDKKVLIFINFDFGQCWRGTVHPVPPPPPQVICSSYQISQLVEFKL